MQTNTPSPSPVEDSFAEVLHLIQSAKQRAYQAVNSELVSLYWQVGEYISRKLDSAEWGDGVVDELAHYLAKTQPGLRGFTRRNLFRMRQFYDCYSDQTFVSAMLTQLPWTHHLLILSYSKREEIWVASSPNWAATSALSAPSFPFRSVGRTSRSICFSSIAG